MNRLIIQCMRLGCRQAIDQVGFVEADTRRLLTNRLHSSSSSSWCVFPPSLGFFLESRELNFLNSKWRHYLRAINDIKSVVPKIIEVFRFVGSSNMEEEFKAIVRIEGVLLFSRFSLLTFCGYIRQDQSPRSLNGTSNTCQPQHSVV